MYFFFIDEETGFGRGYVVGLGSDGGVRLGFIVSVRVVAIFLEAGCFRSE